MKFSDMMGKDDQDATTEVAEAEPPANAPMLPPPPIEARRAPSVPGAEIRFGGVTTAAAPLPAAPSVAPAGLAPSISDVVAELAPRPPSTPSAAPAASAVSTTSAVTDQQIEASSWLDGINDIDDDLLPT
jgi:hypothetical protein